MTEQALQECDLEEEESAVESTESVTKNYIEMVPEAELSQSLGAKRRYICDYARYLGREDHVALGMMLKPQYAKLLRENSDGTRVDLDQVREVDCINMLYAYVRFKISQRK